MTLKSLQIDWKWKSDPGVHNVIDFWVDICNDVSDWSVVHFRETIATSGKFDSSSAPSSTVQTAETFEDIH